MPFSDSHKLQHAQWTYTYSGTHTYTVTIFGKKLTKDGIFDFYYLVQTNLWIQNNSVLSQYQFYKTLSPLCKPKFLFLSEEFLALQESRSMVLSYTVILTSASWEHRMPLREMASQAASAVDSTKPCSFYNSRATLIDLATTIPSQQCHYTNVSKL